MKLKHFNTVENGVVYINVEKAVSVSFTEKSGEKLPAIFTDDGARFTVRLSMEEVLNRLQS